MKNIKIWLVMDYNMEYNLRIKDNSNNLFITFFKFHVTQLLFIALH